MRKIPQPARLPMPGKLREFIVSRVQRLACWLFSGSGYLEAHGTW